MPSAYCVRSWRAIPLAIAKLLLLYRFRDKARYWSKIGFFMSPFCITIACENGCEYFRHVFFTAKPDLWSIRWCKLILQKSQLTHSLGMWQTVRCNSNLSSANNHFSTIFIFFFKNYKSLISFCIIPFLEQLPISFRQSTNQSPSHSPRFIHGSSCTSSPFLPSLAPSPFHSRFKTNLF